MTLPMPIKAIAPVQAPFPYFGGKSPVARIVWARFGRVRHYVEPFFGSGAVLFRRPEPLSVETVNDLDGFIANFWRAVQAEPEAVADLCCWPVSEIDLEARHRWLVTQPGKDEFLDRMKHDPEYYDVKRAGWWCWGLAQWIGSGWCGGEYFPAERANSHGRGVCDGASQRPNISDAGCGVHCQGPASVAERREWLRGWFREIQDRLIYTRILCGDWSRLVGSESVLVHAGEPCGVFLDPPYSAEAGRVNALYREEDTAVAHDVREWCREHGTDKRLRIALCGYEGEHDELQGIGWDCHAWKAGGGYAHRHKGPDSAGKANCHRERIWFSPHCLQRGRQGGLFET